MSWPEIAKRVVNLRGDQPGQHAVRNAVERAQSQSSVVVAEGRYANCGRKSEISEEQGKEIVAFVKMWRHKRFCTCNYIRRELKLKVSKRTVARLLNSYGLFWRPVPKQFALSEAELEKRKAFVEQYESKSSTWWEQNMNLVLDGVTLTTAPKPLSAKQKHAAQRIQHMWMMKGEALDKDVHTHNRYGVQLGTKVPLWGGFTGGGELALSVVQAVRAVTPKAHAVCHDIL